MAPKIKIPVRRTGRALAHLHSKPSPHTRLVPHFAGTLRSPQIEMRSAHGWRQPELHFGEARTRFPASREWHSHSQEPCLTSEFDALRAGRGSEFKPARGIPKTKPHPFGWGFVFVIAYRFCCPHSRPPQGRGSVRGKPLRVSPLAFNHPPAGDSFS